MLSTVKRERGDDNNNTNNNNKKQKNQFRSLDNIFIPKNTFQCILNKCIPCWYKVYPCGHFYSTSKELIKLPSNQRPENCFRSNSNIFGI